ncbi:helix-turn-helix domain-containing protein [Nocardioides sp.]|uniref:helix-turn-helix domain-containing protein n=1 Tax=Nocardioides sp. TaxID=35761 RepID=UPI0039C9E698
MGRFAPYANSGCGASSASWRESVSTRFARIRHGKPHHYWADTREAADLLGVTGKRVRQLIRTDLLPAVQATNGRWYFRRAQLEVVAQRP